MISEFCDSTSTWTWHSLFELHGFTCPTFALAIDQCHVKSININNDVTLYHNIMQFTRKITSNQQYNGLMCKSAANNMQFVRDFERNAVDRGKVAPPSF